MYCPSCGTDLPDNARFCGKCRHEFYPATQAAEPHYAQPSPASPPPIVHGSETAPEIAPILKWGVIAGSLLLPFIGIVMGLIYIFSNPSAEKKAVGKLWLIVGAVMAVVWMLASMNSGTYYY